MSLVNVNKIKLSEFYDLDGKINNRLIIQCNRCHKYKNDIFTNEYCISCLLQIIYDNRFKKLKDISIGFDNEIIIPIRVKDILEFYKNIPKFKKTYQKLVNLPKNCVHKNYRCKDFFIHSSLKKHQYLNPIFFYEVIKKNLDLAQKLTINDQSCIKCILYRRKILIYLLKALKEFDIIKKYNTYLLSNNNDIHNFYESYFSTNFMKKTSLITTNEFFQPSNTKIIDTYNVFFYNVKIYQAIEEVQKLYQISQLNESKAEEYFFSKIIEDTLRNIDDLKFQKIVDFVDLIDIYKKKAQDYIRRKYKNIDANKGEEVAFLISLKKLNFEKIFPLLIDDFIEEVFLDSPDDEIYINHQKHGRCLTGIKFSSTDLERVKTFLRIYSGKRLDYSSPTLKHVLKNRYFHCRFTIDLEPVHNNRFGLDIRKLNKNIYTIQDLLKNETLNPSMAAFLYFCVIKRQNITVTGETDTGKTTLINALDLITPKEFRKIYIENAIESLDQLKYGKHQLKYVVDDFQETSETRSYSKSNQIKTLLHRSPDIIYLGEILTKEEGKAMFHCLAAGLKGFQTIHSKTIESLINRIIFFFKINPSCITDMDIILLMKKQRNLRKVISISEISERDLDIKNNISSIFNYVPSIRDWEQQIQLNDLHLLKKIRQFEDINHTILNKLLNQYEEIFTFLLKCPRIDVEKLIHLFHKISYFSFRSYKELNIFWNLIKEQLDRI